MTFSTFIKPSWYLGKVGSSVRFSESVTTAYKSVHMLSKNVAFVDTPWLLWQLRQPAVHLYHFPVM